MNRNPKSQILNPKSPEAGVTLLLSVLIMSALTLIALAIGGFAIQQLRSSRAVIVTEPTIVAAESGAEKGLWAIKRTSSLPLCPAVNSQSINNVLLNYCESFSAATFNIKGGAPFEFFLYNPNDINGDIDLSDFQYAWMRVTHVSGNFQVSVSTTRLDGSTTGINPPNTTVSPGGVQTINISPVPLTNPETEARMKVTLTSVGDVTVTVDTNQGMPTFPTVDSYACGSRSTVVNCNTTGQEIFTRRINVTVPQ